jgi:hypothetical protein
MLVGKVDEDGDLISLWIVSALSQCLKKCCDGDEDWLFRRPMTEDRKLVRCGNCRRWNNSARTGMLSRAPLQGARSCCLSLASAPVGLSGCCATNKVRSFLSRLSRYIWPYTEDTDRWGSFKLGMPSPSRTRRNSDGGAG